ncbi:pirin-like C-terminal cupin domain-containing protein [Dyella sp. GSA-30]|uniref:pirin family protein n=1 Tax=Dyella sp. GSA-30 TaxID=2994496 RepID=UPI00248FF16C|nr:pirin-like C-terminal cupin domain-containing protein [Dyella sp. GSA-30]BDU21478.1 hypothetical protein DYGSA30_29350 [Dyella sp. GSA-30]
MHSQLPALRIVDSHDMRIGDGFEAKHFNESMFDGLLDPVVMVDHFHMTSPTFAPHPHAGISAVTYMFEDSTGPHVNYDSLGNHGPIRPGDLHWFVAGRGAVHTEQPEGKGDHVHALQIFVNLPARLKFCEPYAVRLDAADVPAYEAPGTRVRVVAGQWQGFSSPVTLPTPFLLLDGFLEHRAKISHTVPEDWHATILVVQGTLHVIDQTGHRTLTTGQALAVSGAAELELAGDGTGTHIALLSGPALREPIAKHGPFVMNTQAELIDRIRAYEAGELGHVDLVAP